MTVERVTLHAIRYTDERGVTMHRIPLLDPRDGKWWVLDEDGVSVFDDPAAIRAFADEWDDDSDKFDDEGDAIASLRALADLLDEVAGVTRTQIIHHITAADLDAVAGRELTQDELDRFRSAFPHSSLPECVEAVLDAITNEVTP